MKAIIILFAFSSVVRAQVHSSGYLVMPALFSDNMVLQQKSDVPVWGKALPGEKVVVKAGWGAAARTIVSPDSNWEVHLKTVKAGGPFEMRVMVGDSALVYRNVMLGEVWLCSGQSNMEIPMEGWPPQYPIRNSTEEIRDANYPDIRLFHVARDFSANPQFNCVGFSLNFIRRRTGRALP